MSTAKTGIEWTGRTWNPVRGCSLVSPGCTNCYAMKLAHRFSGAGKPYEGLTRKRVSLGPVWTGEVRTVPDALGEPLSWRAPTTVFVNSMSDLFHEDVPDGFIDDVFGVMSACEFLGRDATPGHTFQVLTKRAEAMRKYLSVDRRIVWARAAALHGGGINPDGVYDAAAFRSGPMPHVHLGVSVEDRKHGLPRIEHLRATPAALRFLSVEPLLEDLGDLDLSGIGWVIVGGESGPHARKCDLGWIRRVVAQCSEQQVPCFVKQLGARPCGEWGPGRTPPTHYHPARRDEWILNDAKGGDLSEWPEALRVREMPR